MRYRKFSNLAVFRGSRVWGQIAVIYIQPGTYLENLVFSGIGASLVGAPGLNDSQSVRINGSHTFSVSGNIFIPKVSLTNLDLNNASSIISHSGSGVLTAITINLINCRVRITQGYTVNITNTTANVNIINSRSNNLGNSNNNGWVNITQSGSNCEISNSYLSSSGIQAMNIVGILTIKNSIIFPPVNINNSIDFACSSSVFYRTVSCFNNSSGIFGNSLFRIITGPAIIHNSTQPINVISCGINTSNNPAIDGTGAGILRLTGVDFGQGNNISTNLTVSGGNSLSGSFKTTDSGKSLIITGNSIGASGSNDNVDISMTPKGTGDVVAESGNLVINEQGKQLQINGGGSSPSIGLLQLTNGTVTIPFPNATNDDRIFFSRKNIAGSTALGQLEYSITVGTGFTINSYQASNPSTIETGDNSQIDYIIIRDL